MDKYWDNIHINFTSYYDEWLNEYIKEIPKDDLILEIGCGRGYNSQFLFNTGYKNLIATDISQQALILLNEEIPELKTQELDITNPLPFKDNSVKVIIADLCLHYFDHDTTINIFNEFKRILKTDGYVIARVNSTKDSYYIPKNATVIQKNYLFDGTIYKRFF